MCEPPGFFQCGRFGTKFIEQESMLLASQLLRYGCYLAQVANSAAFDYSAVQVVSRWIIEAARIAPPAFNKLLVCAKRLEDVVSLSSGLGFHDIWSKFLPERHSKIRTESSKELETLAISYNDDVSQFGELFRIIPGFFL